MVQLRTFRKLAVALSGTAIFGISHAGNDPAWLQIENPYFRVYTDGSAAKVVPLVEELDRFRQAVLIVADWQIPAGAPPVDVLMLDTGFRKLIDNLGASGMAIPLDSDPGLTAATILVMPVRQHRGVDGRVVLRHEYVHALSRFRPLKFPWWYMEGIAEVFAYTRVDGSDIIIDVPGDRIRSSDQGRALGYDTWVSFDTVVDLGYGRKRYEGLADVYLEAWLLTHYLTLGAPELAPQLEKCLLYSDGGMPPVKAFTLAFGKSPQEFWHDKLKYYTLQLRGHHFQLAKPIEAEPLSVTPISASVAEAKIDAVRERRKKKSAPE